MLSVELEMDDFNNHECMAHLCAIVKYLTSETVIGSTIKVIYCTFIKKKIILLVI